MGGGDRNWFTGNGDRRRWGGSPLRLLIGATLLALCAGLLGPVSARAADPAPEIVPGQALVQYREGASEGARRAARGRVGASQRSVLRRQANGEPGLEVVELPASANVRATIALLAADPAVEFAEPNFRYSDRPIAAAQPSDPYFTGDWHWGMYGETPAATCRARNADGSPRCSNKYGSQASEVWAAGLTGSPKVYVAVIDSGIDRNHPDFRTTDAAGATVATNIGVNPGEVPDNGLDDDKNGYADDVYGWNFAATDADHPKGTNQTFVPTDDENHGTHVAGTIGARANNDTGTDGVVGVNWDVKILSGKFFGSGGQGGSLDAAVRAIDYFIDLKARHRLNLVAINASWGCYCYSQALADAIGRANAANILLVAAAGNDANNNDASKFYPASYALPNVIAVAALDEFGGLASFSNYGARTVQLAAPGQGIGSTLAGGGYGFWSGTSMAAPHVTGAAALYAATRLGANGKVTATAAQVRQALLDGATYQRTTSLQGRTATGGRLDLSCTKAGTGGAFLAATCKRLP